MIITDAQVIEQHDEVDQGLEVAGAYHRAPDRRVVAVVGEVLHLEKEDATVLCQQRGHCEHYQGEQPPQPGHCVRQTQDPHSDDCLHDGHHSQEKV